MKRTLSLVALVALSLALGGCWRFPFGSSWGGSSSSYDDYSRSNLVLTNGNQAGDMGEIRGFDGSASRHDGYYDSYGANLRIDLEGSDWWTMSSIHVTGDLMGEAFAPGTRRTYTSGTYDSANNVSVTGCSGPSYGNYTYDHSADTVSIEVEDLGGGVRRMHFETIYTTYDGTPQVTTGSVDYTVPDDRGI
jgi:hypothetical protein